MPLDRLIPITLFTIALIACYWHLLKNLNHNAFIKHPQSGKRPDLVVGQTFSWLAFFQLFFGMLLLSRFGFELLQEYGGLFLIGSMALLFGGVCIVSRFITARLFADRSRWYYDTGWETSEDVLRLITGSFFSRSRRDCNTDRKMNKDSTWHFDGYAAIGAMSKFTLYVSVLFGLFAGWQFLAN